MTASSTRAEASVEHLDVSVYKVPTDFPESDGTAEWDATTIILVEAHAGGRTGLGWTYGDVASAAVIRSTLADVVAGRDALRVTAAWQAMVIACRNLGRPGVASMAIAAVDTALWDLKARLLELPLATLLDAAHESVPVYGSGGFCSYPDERLAEQLGGWVAQAIPRVKMKVGRDPDHDLERVRVARAAIGPDTELYVDANGALSRVQALWFAERYAEDFDVRWFEEPVSSDDLEGLRFLRDRAPGGMDIAAGEYGYKLDYFEKMLAAGAVTCLQADVTRGEGITGFLRVAALCQARSLELSAHCGPSIHAHPAVRSCRFATWSTSTTTRGWSGCCSTECWRQRTGLCVPTSTGRETGWSSSAPTPSATRSDQRKGRMGILAKNRSRPVPRSEHFIDRAASNIEQGRFERSLSGLTAFAAAVTTAEIYLEHYRASFGNKMMWSPIVVTPPVMVAGIGGVFSRRWAKTYLPITALVYSANGLLGEYYHARGVARKPGGFGQASYNVPMGPPIMAPGLMTIVGAMGLLAALLRRED